MSFGSRTRAHVVAVLTLLALPEGAARAANDDAAIAASAEKILANDFANANYGDARKKLRGLLDRCKKAACSAPTLAEIHLGLGMVAAQINQADDAKSAFLEALNADENATLPSAHATPPMKAAWAEAQKAWLAAHPQPDDATKAGWASKPAFELAKQAQAADAAGSYSECIEKDKAALLLEEQPRARLHLSACEAHANKVIDGLRDAQKALEGATRAKDDSVAKAAQKRLEDLLPRVAHVGFEVPGGVQDIRITFDEKPVPNDKLGQKFSIDPGKHHAHAEGNVSGAVLTYDGDVEAKDGETISVKVTLKPTALTPGQLSCMLSAKTQEDILKCLPQQAKTLVVRAGMEVGAYTDTAHVHVLTPAINAAVSSPTAGWNVGASYVVDVVTAASPDIVSSASNRFRDVRHAVAATGGYKPARFGAQLSGFFSSEHDYLSRGGGISLNGDFFDKQVTPQLGFSYSKDTIGRTGTPFSIFSNTLSTSELQAGTTIVATRTSIFVIGATMQLERGDQSKPYRYVPMFAAGDNVPVGASIGSVNVTRLPVKPLEQLPLERDRYALALRYAVRLGNATLRLEERVYTDSWNLHATTSDARYILDTSRRLRVWPHVHVNLQTPASFYQRVYTATLNSDGSTDLPKWRTDDRELSPLATLTLGGGMRYALSAPGAKVQYAISLQADAMGTKYFNALFIKYRLAGYGTLGFDVEFE